MQFLSKVLSWILLEHPSYFSNPSLMDENNLTSLHVDSSSLPNPTRGSRRSQNDPLPHLSHPHLLLHINSHKLIHTHHIFYLLFLWPPLMTILTVVY